MLRLFGKDLLRYLPGEAALIILSLFTIPILTRVLSPEHFGYYALVMSSVVISVTLFGSFPMGIVRFYPAVPETDRDILVRTSVWTQIFLVIVAASCFLVLAWLLWSSNSGFRRLLVVGMCIAALQSVFQILVETLRASRRVEAYNLFKVWSRVAGLALGLLLAIVFDLGALGILWGIALGFVTALPFLWLRVFADLRSVGPISAALAREVGGFGFPLVVGNLGGWALSLCDRYFIQAYFGSHEVGLYAAAYSISERSIAMMAAYFMLSSTPLLTNVWEKEGRKASQDLLVSITRMYLIVSIPAVVGLSILAEPIMRVMTGSEFSAGYSIVPWVTAGAFFLGLQHRYNQVLKLLKCTRAIMFWITVSGVLNIVLNWWLLPLYDYKIAAVNTFVCYIVLCIGQASSARRKFHWPFPWLTTLRCSLAAAFMAGGILVLRNTISAAPISLLCLAMPIGMVIYAVSVCVLGEISTAELRMFHLTKKQRAQLTNPTTAR